MACRPAISWPARWMRMACSSSTRPAVTARGIGLALQRRQLTADLAQEVVEAQEVALGGFEPPLGALTPLAELQDAGGFLDDRAPVLGPRVQHRVELALPHDHVLLTADAGVGEQLLDVEQSTRRTVDLVLGVAGAEQRAGDRHLAEFDGQQPGAVVDAQRHLGAPERGTIGRAGEDDVVHLAAAQRARALGAEHPGDGVDEVRLPRTVGPDHHRHARFELQDRLVGERLEASERQRLEEHVGGSDGCAATDGRGGRWWSPRDRSEPPARSRGITGAAREFPVAVTYARSRTTRRAGRCTHAWR